MLKNKQNKSHLQGVESKKKTIQIGTEINKTETKRTLKDSMK